MSLPTIWLRKIGSRPIPIKTARDLENLSLFKDYQSHKVTINLLNKLWIAQLSFKSFLIIHMMLHFLMVSLAMQVLIQT